MKELPFKVSGAGEGGWGRICSTSSTAFEDEWLLLFCEILARSGNQVDGSPRIRIELPHISVRLHAARGARLLF